MPSSCIKCYLFILIPIIIAQFQNQMKFTNFSIIFSIFFLLFSTTLALTGPMALSPNTRYVNTGKITVETTTFYNPNQPLTWSPLTFINIYPLKFYGSYSNCVILGLVDLKMTASSSRIQFKQEITKGDTSFTVRIFSVLANYIQRMSYRYLILSMLYVQNSNLVYIEHSWALEANLTQKTPPSPYTQGLLTATVFNTTGTIISYCFITGMDVKSTTPQNILSFFITASIASQNEITLVTSYLTSTSNVPTYVSKIYFTFLAFNLGFYQQANASFYYGNIQAKTGSYAFNYNNSNNYDNVTIMGLAGLSVQGDNYLDFTLELAKGNFITISSNNSDNFMRSFPINYVTMLTLYCMEPTPFLDNTSFCYDVCPVRTYPNPSLITCIACPYECYTCDNTGCLTCNTLSDFRIFNSSSSKCVPLDGYYDNLTTICVKCAQNCLKCINASNCLNCVTGSYLSGGICKGCMVGCSACISSSKCQSCYLGFSLAADFVCYLSCNSRQYFNISTLSCQPCLKNCSICISSTSCINCSSNHYYNYRKGVCVKCIDGCATCLDGLNCLTCKQGYFYNNSQCNACPLNCQQCDNATSCNLCNSDYSMNAGQCKVSVSQAESKSTIGMPIAIAMGVGIGGFVGVLALFIYRKCRNPEPRRRASVIMKGDMPMSSLHQITAEELSAQSGQNEWLRRAIPVTAKKDCSICLLEQSFFKTYCGHNFHLKCIIEWLKKRDTCPNCREKVSGQKHKVYCRKCNSQYKVVTVTTLKEMVANKREQAETTCDDCRLFPI